MTTPHFNSEEERKAFWAGWLEVRGQVWDALRAEGIDKPTMEQYFAKGEQLSQEYIEQWMTPQPHKGGEITGDVEEVVTHTPSVTEVSTPMEDENLEAPEIEDDQTPQPPIGGEITGDGNRTHEACLPLQGVLSPLRLRKRQSRAGGSVVLKVLICLASIISALCVGGWIMPLVCITPLFLVFSYEQEKMQRSLVVHDSPALYQYGTRSCQ